ncbi:MAG: transposase [Burkholderiales bacterium]|nr:MAG: transposase [Betaproteobacteria bacterium]TAG84725.1 MAG: transposase [Burkholderiales bacterium]
MPDYKRIWLPGGTYFFTVNLADRSSDLLIRHAELLRHAVRRTREAHRFEIVAWAVLPDHMHAIWTLPPDDHDYALRWRAIKAIFSRGLPRDESTPTQRVARGERGIWQRRYWEHTIRDDRDLENHINYVHFNPVKHGHVTKIEDWPFSSFHRYRQRGTLPANWANPDDLDLS